MLPEVEPRLKTRRLAIRAEGRSVSKRSIVYERENSGVARSARLEDVLSF